MTANGPQNIISLIVGGMKARGRYAPMPAISAGMSDQDVGDVANFVRQILSNAAPPTAMVGMVGQARDKVDTLMDASSDAKVAEGKSSAIAKVLKD